MPTTSGGAGSILCATHCSIRATCATSMSETQRSPRPCVRHGNRSLDEVEILEVGCGTGGELVRLLAMGASMANLYGVDLLPESMRTAEARLPGAHLVPG